MSYTEVLEKFAMAWTPILIIVVILLMIGGLSSWWDETDPE